MCMWLLHSVIISLGRFCYRQTSNISRSLGGNKIVDYPDVVGTSPVGVAPTKFKFNYHWASYFEIMSWISWWDCLVYDLTGSHTGVKICVCWTADEISCVQLYSMRYICHWKMNLTGSTTPLLISTLLNFAHKPFTDLKKLPLFSWMPRSSFKSGVTILPRCLNESTHLSFSLPRYISMSFGTVLQPKSMQTVFFGLNTTSCS